MLSGRLVRIIEDHAEALTASLIGELRRDPRCAAYHKLGGAELYKRTFNIYHNLGEWLMGKAESSIEDHFSNLGKQRAIEGIPLSQVVYALIRTKSVLFTYIRRMVLLESAVDLYQIQEFRRLTDNFFDHATYYIACGYEREQALTYAVAAQRAETAENRVRH